MSIIIVYISSHWWIHPFIHYIKRANIVLHAFSFTEMIQIYVMIIFFVALCLIIPIIFFQLWSFIAPGLHKQEQYFIIKYSVWCGILFLLGITFAFFIGFPLLIRFSLNLSSILDISPTIGFKEYLSELLRWLFIFGLLFQLPTLFLGLSKFDLIDVDSLGHYRKYIYFFSFVLASIIAPPDITLNILLTLPILLLFEFSMMIAKLTQKKNNST